MKFIKKITNLVVKKNIIYLKSQTFKNKKNKNTKKIDLLYP